MPPPMMQHSRAHPPAAVPREEGKVVGPCHWVKEGVDGDLAGVLPAGHLQHCLAPPDKPQLSGQSHRCQAHLRQQPGLSLLRKMQQAAVACAWTGSRQVGKCRGCGAAALRHLHDSVPERMQPAGTHHLLPALEQGQRRVQQQLRDRGQARAAQLGDLRGAGTRGAGHPGAGMAQAGQHAGHDLPAVAQDHLRAHGQPQQEGAWGPPCAAAPAGARTSRWSASTRLSRRRRRAWTSSLWPSGVPCAWRCITPRLSSAGTTHRPHLAQQLERRADVQVWEALGEGLTVGTLHDVGLVARPASQHAPPGH